ncbi:uncharacterized protein LOC130673040 [Microplitis mediator]|uniref:uncharacterized protein LOC130673040 n=1 Tax=Microplitis mediator TaxID=375433 RepID=UPI00255786C4|nr:uncharacterized protein LOC130673040 [Microplitis mediator]
MDPNRQNRPAFPEFEPLAIMEHIPLILRIAGLQPEANGHSYSNGHSSPEPEVIVESAPEPEAPEPEVAADVVTEFSSETSSLSSSSSPEKCNCDALAERQRRTKEKIFELIDALVDASMFQYIEIIDKFCSKCSVTLFCEVTLQEQLTRINQLIRNQRNILQ